MTRKLESSTATTVPPVFNGRSPTAEQEQASRLLAGNPETVAEVRRWVRGASTPYRRHLARDLEDMEQQVLIDLLNTLRGNRFRGESSLATYVRRMVHNKCLNIVRDSRRREWVDIEDVNLKSQEPSPFEEAASRATVNRTLRVLAEMSEACRELWRMIHNDLSYLEMSERVGVSAGTLRVRVLRCRQQALKLRDQMETGA